MDVLVTGRRCTITDEFRDKVTSRIASIERFRDRVIRVEVQVSTFPYKKQPDQSTRVEITLYNRGPVVRAEASADDKSVAFDHALDRLKGQLKRAADRRKAHRGLRTPQAADSLWVGSPEAPAGSAEQEGPAVRKIAGLEVTGDGPLVVREKVFDATPLSLAQALDEMELVGHDFFLYIDAETGAPSVVYRRKAYDYGVIHLRTEGEVERRPAAGEYHVPRLRLDQARRAALAAQGFARSRPARVGVRHVARVIDDVAQFQVDSVNVAVRAHYMPLFARLGPYDTALLDAASGRAPRRLYEYWGHAASLIDVRLEPALRLRRARFGVDRPPALRRILQTKPDLLDRILAELTDRGPLTARDIENAEIRRREDWGWNWSEAKHVLEYLFDTGRVSVAGRNSAFERRYDLAERVLPPAVFAQQDPDPDEAYLALVRRAARALGVADLVALSEYFYLSRAAVKRAVARLETLGEVEAVEVEGIPRPYWLWTGARLPRRLDVRALVSPFDTLVFERQRLEELFGTRYRIEIYTPPARREYGYYVYLYVHGDQIAARVDLKADRGAGVLRVQAAWLEPGADEAETAAGLAGELERMAEWLGLDEVRVAPVGTLAAALARRGFAPTMGPNA